MTIYIPRPIDYDYALLSNHAYGGKVLKKGDRVADTNWEVYSTESEGDMPVLNYFGGIGYFGVIYVNQNMRQIVVAHRGTDNLKTLLVDDIQEVYFGHTDTQHKAAYRLVEKAVNLAKEGEWHLSFTGHSLGAFLAELSVLYCLRSDFFNYPRVSAVTFESPGSRESLEKLNANHADGKIDVDALDITSYLSYPNIVNTAHHHVGTLYSLMPNVGDKAKWHLDWYTRVTHSMDNIITLFKDAKGKVVAPLILDWPVGNQRSIYDKYAKLKGGQYQVIKSDDFRAANKQQFRLLFESHFQKSDELNNQNSAALRHFSLNTQRLLVNFYDLLLYDILSNVDKTKQFSAQLEKQQFPALIIQWLMQFIVFKLSSHTIMVKLNEDCLQRSCKTIKDFREEIEAWLVTGAKETHFIELLKAAGISAGDKRLQVIARGIEAGVRLDEGSIVDIKEVIANGLEIKTVSGDDIAVQIKQMMEDLVTKVSTISAVGIPAGAHVHKGATVSIGTVKANGVSIGQASTQSPMLNQAPHQPGKHKREDEPAELGEPVALGDFGHYISGPILCRVTLDLAEIPDDKEAAIQGLMKKAAKNCETSEHVYKNHAGDIKALELSENDAEQLVKKLCEFLEIENPLKQGGKSRKSKKA